VTIEAARLSVVVDADTSGAEGGIDKVDGKVSKLGGALATGAKALAGFGSAAGGGALAATLSLEGALTPIGTLLGTNTEAFATMSDSLTDFIKSSPGSPDEIGMAAYMGLSAGITDQAALMDALAQSQKLAQAGLGDIGGSMDLVTSAMNSFTGEGLTAQEAAETFFGAVASGKTTTADLANGFGQLAPFASAAGVGFTDLLAATAALTSTGQSASTAYAGIKGALSAIVAPTKEASDTAEGLGLNFSQAHLAAVGLPAFLDEIKTATGGNVETMAQLFGGVEGLNTVLALTGPQSEAFTANLTNVGTAGDTMAERASEASETLANRFKQAKNFVVGYVGEMGLELINAFKLGDTGDYSSGIIGVVQRIGVAARNTVDWFVANWPQIQATAATVFSAIVAAVSPVIDVIGFVVENFEYFIPVLAGVGIAILASVVPAFIAQAAAATVAAVATLAAAAPFIAIGVAIAAVGAALIYAYQHWDGFRVVVDKVRAWVVDTLVPGLGRAWDLISTGVGALVDGIKWAFENVLAPAFDFVVGAVGFAARMVEAYINLIWTVASGVFTGIGLLVDKVLVPAWNLVASAAKFAFNDVLIPAFEAVVGAVNVAWDVIEPVLDRIGGAFTLVGDLAAGAFTGAIKALRTGWNAIAGIWNSTLGSFSFKVPDFVPVFGGKSFSMPKMPVLKSAAVGGRTTSSGWVEMGGAEMVRLPSGSTVYPAGEGGIGTTFNLNGVVIHATTREGGMAAARGLRQQLAEYGRITGSAA
jgi:TP901 family phage tail tape measure protein